MCFETCPGTVSSDTPSHVITRGRNAPITAPRLMRKVWTTYPSVFCESSSMSATRARNGCMVTLKERSMKRRMNAPIARGAIARSTGQFGIRSRAMVEMTAPPRMYGIRRPNLVQVPSENMPMMG